MNVQDKVKRLRFLRHRLIGRKVIGPDGRTAFVVETRWEPDSSLAVRLRPPGKPGPRIQLAEGVPRDPKRVLTLADVDEVGGEHCYWAPGSGCQLVA